jgi:hypothetical protein
VEGIQQEVRKIEEREHTKQNNQEKYRKKETNRKKGAKNLPEERRKEVKKNRNPLVVLVYIGRCPA